MNNNHSQTPAQDASVRALKKINELLARHWHLDSVGLGNCRAAQAILRELNEQLLIQSASLLANAGFDSNEPRDSHGQWATTGTATNRPTHANKAHTPDHPGANDSTKPKTVGTGAATKPAPALAQPPEKITLSTNEPALMIERLLLAETKGVEESGFNKAEALKNMQAIGALLYNRTHAQELGFTSFHYPTNLLTLIRQTNQFAGFEHYNPQDTKGGLSSNLLRRVDICIQGANYSKDKMNYTNYLDVVKQAKAIAQDLTKGSVDDPFSPWFTFGVKTAGPKHVGPGGSFQFLGTAAGNNFYGFPPPNTKNIQVHP